jgi:peptidyl-prolyl cis-trans isomerase SurA
MTSRLLAPVAACFSALTFALVCGPATAQALRPSNTLTLPSTTTAARVPTGLRQADYIVAIVNTDPITNTQVQLEVRRALQQLSPQAQAGANARDISAQVLDRLINDQVQLTQALETGIKVEATSIDQAVQSVMRQNKIDLVELKNRLAKDGMEFSQFRNQLRDQITLTRLRERDVEPRVKISDAEVEQYLRDQQDISSNPANVQINLAHILIAVPEAATTAEQADMQAKAQTALTRARAGEDFAALARELSNATDRANGGQLGMRSADRYPPLFLEATHNLSEGALSGLVRSGAGWHILKVIEKRSANLPPTTVAQSRSRHILLALNAQTSEAAAVERLNDFKKRIQAGLGDFAALARENSQDGSAPQGGDLGWANPGQFVPEFEAALQSLAPGEISAPLTSRFGVHLIQMLERRNTTLGEREQREMVRNMLREKKLDETYTAWIKDLRARAYVELRDPPQ